MKVSLQEHRRVSFSSHTHTHTHMHTHTYTHTHTRTFIYAERNTRLHTDMLSSDTDGQTDRQRDRHMHARTLTHSHTFDKTLSLR